MSNRITPERLKEIKERCEQATPGPWRVGNPYVWAGVNDGSHRNWKPPAYIKHGECALCHLGEPVATVQDMHGQNFHVHRDPNYDSDPSLYGGYWHVIVSESTYEEITGNRDSEYEEGGVCSKPEDAEFIAHAREDVPALVDEVERLHRFVKEIRRTARHWRRRAKVMMAKGKASDRSDDAHWFAGQAEAFDQAAWDLEIILESLGGNENSVPGPVGGECGC